MIATYVLTLVNLFQSEVFVQIFSLGLVVLLFALTYLFGFKSNDSPNDNQQDKQQQQQQPTLRQATSVGNKQKRQSKTQQETLLPVTSTTTPVPSSPKQQVNNFY